MRRRGAGIAGLQRQALAKEHYREAGYAIAAGQFEQLNAQLDMFRTHLSRFAQDHTSSLRKDPVVRARFLQLCSLLDVDPLSVEKGTLLSRVMGTRDPLVGLDMQIVEAAASSRAYDGGLISLADLHTRISIRRDGISEEDVIQAIEGLAILGAGWEIILIGGTRYVKTLPSLLSADTPMVLSLMQKEGWIDVPTVVDRLGWAEARARTCMEDALRHGICWLDTGVYPSRYWVPAFMGGLLNA